MDTTLVNKITSLLGSGTKIDDIDIPTISGLDDSVCDAIVDSRRVPESEVGGAALKNIRYLYMLNRESWCRRLDINGYEQWCDEHGDTVILNTYRTQRNRGNNNEKQESFDAMIRMHHTWNDSIKNITGIPTIVDTNSNATSIDDVLLNESSTHECDLVIMPLKYSTTVLDASRGIIAARPQWIDQFKNDTSWTEVVHEGWVAGYKKTIGNRRVFACTATQYYDNTGKLINDRTGDLYYTSIVANSLNGTIVNTDATEQLFTDDQVVLFDEASAAIAFVKSQLSVVEDERANLTDSVNDLREDLQRLQDKLLQNKLSLTGQLKRLEELERSGYDPIINSINKATNDIIKIINEKPVKHAEIILDNNKKPLLSVELHPLILNCKEQEEYDRWCNENSGEEYISGRGEPHLRYLDQLQFTIKLDYDSSDGIRVNDIIKWKTSDNNWPGHKTNKVHPHAYPSGSTCWGEAAGPITDSLAAHQYHDLVQWIFAWCNGFSTGEPNFTTSWLFKPAPAGMVEGWVV